MITMYLLIPMNELLQREPPSSSEYMFENIAVF